MSKQAETKFKEKVLRDLQRRPDTWFVKVQQRAIRGTPDVLACVAGRFVALELKASRSAHIERLQTYTLNCIRAAGGIAQVVFPENWDDVFGEIEAIGAKNDSDKVRPV